MVISLLGLIVLVLVSADAAQRKASVSNVFYVHTGRYTYNYNAAVAACKQFGAQLASLAQLTEAYNKGMSQCNWGWTTDKKTHYPVNDKKDKRGGCGGISQGIRNGGPRNADAYCYSVYSAGSVIKGVFYLHKGRYDLSYDEAAAACDAQGAKLATNAQLLAAYNAGLSQCDWGWTLEKSVRYPARAKKDLRAGCGGTTPGIRVTSSMKSADAYCYRA